MSGRARKISVTLRMMEGKRVKGKEGVTKGGRKRGIEGDNE